MADQISLKIAGVNYEGWQSVRVERSLGQISGTFGFKATDIFPGQSEKWGIRMGLECTVAVNDKACITGYVDGIDISYSEDSHTFQVRGRDRTGDLVDCSHDSTKTEWKNATVLAILQDLCSPLDVSVSVDPSASAALAEKMLNFKAGEGDAVFETIIKLLSIKAILPVTLGDGKLTLTRRGTEYVNDRIEMGKNVKAGHFAASDTERYNVYIVKSQNIGSDDWDLTSINQPAARHLDSVITRTRPLVVLPGASATVSQCRDRAEWEARTRSGKSRQFEYELVGWTQSNGDLWPLNKLVIVSDEYLDVNESFLITGISQSFDDLGGSITRLGLESPDAYDLLRQTVTKKSKFDLDPQAVKDFLAR